MFIQTEATPNPATLKFIPGQPGARRTARSNSCDREATQGLAAGARLFEIDGVKGVFFGTDFISVTKGDGEWQHLKPAILGAIMEHYSRAQPVTEARDRDRKAPARASSSRPRTRRPSRPSRSCSRRACGRPWPRTAATSPSRATATAWCSCICAAPARAARARRRRSVTASRTCSPLHPRGAGGPAGLTEAAFLITRKPRMGDGDGLGRWRLLSPARRASASTRWRGSSKPR